MRKYNLIATMIISSSLVAGNASAEDSTNINKELSEVRTDISVQVLQNRLYDAELEGLQKRKEIKDLKDSLEGSDTKITAPIKKRNDNIDHSLKFDESLNDEDILSENNNWEQNVGFIYQDDVSFGSSGQINNSNQGLPSLVEENDDEVFSKLIEDTLTTLEDEEDNEELNQTSMNASNFNLVSLELNKLTVFDDHKSAKVKVNYMSNNGYQTIKGAKISNVTEGKVFEVKGEVSFEVLEITEDGVKVKNLNSDKVTFVTK